jgi:Circularly permutated YpsA SLOG family
VLEKIVSGGQTGVDRAGLDVAIALGIPHGGWCPKDRKAEDGEVPSVYQLQETPSADYRERTASNVRDSDGTLILTRGQPTGGTASTIKLADRFGKPCLVLDLLASPDNETVLAWIADNDVRVLNIAGPRESGCPGIHDQAQAFLEQCLQRRRET